MNEQRNLPDHNPNNTMMSVVVGVLAIVISAAILFALIDSASTLAQVIAFGLILVAFIFFAYLGLHLIRRDDEK